MSLDASHLGEYRPVPWSRRKQCKVRAAQHGMQKRERALVLSRVPIGGMKQDVGVDAAWLDEGPTN